MTLLILSNLLASVNFGHHRVNVVSRVKSASTLMKLSTMTN